MRVADDCVLFGVLIVTGYLCCCSMFSFYGNSEFILHDLSIRMIVLAGGGVGGFFSRWQHQCLLWWKKKNINDSFGGQQHR